MSAEILREAAAEMRRVAEQATPGRWKLWGMTVMADQDGTSNVDNAVGVAQTFFRDEHDKPRTWDADQIAGMQPCVALALADLLDVWVEHDLLSSSGSLADEKAAILSLARVYLGGSQ